MEIFAKCSLSKTSKSDVKLLVFSLGQKLIVIMNYLFRALLEREESKDSLDLLVSR